MKGFGKLVSKRASKVLSGHGSFSSVSSLRFLRSEIGEMVEKVEVLVDEEIKRGNVPRKEDVLVQEEEKRVQWLLANVVIVFDRVLAVAKVAVKLMSLEFAGPGKGFPEYCEYLWEGERVSSPLFMKKALKYLRGELQRQQDMSREELDRMVHIAFILLFRVISILLTAGGKTLRRMQDESAKRIKKRSSKPVHVFRVDDVKALFNRLVMLSIVYDDIIPRAEYEVMSDSVNRLRDKAEGKSGGARRQIQMARRQNLEKVATGPETALALPGIKKEVNFADAKRKEWNMTLVEKELEKVIDSNAHMNEARDTAKSVLDYLRFEFEYAVIVNEFVKEIIQALSNYSDNYKEAMAVFNVIERIAELTTLQLGGYFGIMSNPKYSTLEKFASLARDMSRGVHFVPPLYSIFEVKREESIVLLLEACRKDPKMNTKMNKILPRLTRFRKTTDTEALNLKKAFQPYYELISKHPYTSLGHRTEIWEAALRSYKAAILVFPDSSQSLYDVFRFVNQMYNDSIDSLQNLETKITELINQDAVRRAFVLLGGDVDLANNAVFLGSGPLVWRSPTQDKESPGLAYIFKDVIFITQADRKQINQTGTLGFLGRMGRTKLTVAGTPSRERSSTSREMDAALRIEKGRGFGTLGPSPGNVKARIVQTFFKDDCTMTDRMLAQVACDKKSGQITLRFQHKSDGGNNHIINFHISREEEDLVTGAFQFLGQTLPKSVQMSLHEGKREKTVKKRAEHEETIKNVTETRIAPEVTEDVYDFFISHSQRNGSYQAYILRDGLVSRGYRVWLDKDRDEVNMNEMREGVAQSKTVILFLTNEALQSIFVNIEMTEAKDRGKHVIVIYETKKAKGGVDLTEDGTIDIGAFKSKYPDYADLAAHTIFLPFSVDHEEDRSAMFAKIIRKFQAGHNTNR